MNPVREMRRICNTVSEAPGYRTLQQFSGGDVCQLKVMLNALGLCKKGGTIPARGGDVNLFTSDLVPAIDAFRETEKMRTSQNDGSPAGLVEEETVTHLRAALERAGQAIEVRKTLLESTQVRR